MENLPAHYAKQHPRSKVPEELRKEATEVVQAERTQRRKAPVTITNRGKIAIALVAVILVAILVVIIINPFRVGPNVGREAPDFTLRSSTGASVTLSGLRGKPVLLEFMDVDCPHCQNEATNSFSPLYSVYRLKVNFLSVDVNFVGDPDTDARIETFKATYNTPWTYALDVDRAVQGAYGVSGTPTTFILNGNGIVTAILIGEKGASAYSTAMDAALAG